MAPSGSTGLRSGGDAVIVQQFVEWFTEQESDSMPVYIRDEDDNLWATRTPIVEHSRVILEMDIPLLLLE